MKVFLPSRALLILSILCLLQLSVFGFFQNSISKAKTKYEFTDTRISAADSLLKNRKYQEALEAYQIAYDIFESESFYEGMVYTKERMALCYRALRRPEESKIAYFKAIQLARAHLRSNHMLLAKAYTENARRAHHIGEIIDATRLLDTAMNVYKAAISYDSNVLERIVNYKFYSYYVSNQSIDTIMQYLDYRAAILDSNKFDPTARLRLLNDYSRGFLQSGDFQKAMSYSIEAQKLGVEFPNIQAQDYTTALFNLGRAFYSQGEFQRAIDVTDGLINYTLEKIPNYIELLAYYNLRAISLSGMKKFDLAAEEFDRLISMLEKRGQNDYFYRTAVMNLGVCYELMGEFDIAKQFLFKALEDERGEDKSLNANYIDRYRYIGQYFSAKGDYENAVLYYDSALRSGIPTYKEELLLFPSDSMLKPSFNVLTVLKNKALSLNSFNASLSKDSVSILKSTVTYVTKTHDYLLRNRESLQASQGRLFLSEDFKSLYEAGIEACYRLYELGIEEDYYFEKGMSFSGLSKSILFLEQSGELGYVQNSSLPINVKREFFELKTEIDRLEANFYDASVDNIRSDSMRQMNSTLLKYTNDLEQLKDSLELVTNTVSQAFSTIEFKLEVPLNYINSLDNAGLIEYFVGPSSVYVFGLTKGKKALIKLNFDESFDHAFRELISEISQRPLVEDYEPSLEKFKRSSSYVYKALISGIIDSLGENIKRLIIVPDEQLSKLPFEVLLQTSSNNKEFYELDYMIMDYSIQYSLSSQQLGIKTPARRAKKRLLGIGFSGIEEGSERNGNSQGGLPGTEQEIRFLESRIDGDYLLGSKGSKNEFLLRAKDYDILHLAIHGKSDVTNRYGSSLLFNGDNNVLKTSDLYVANLNSRIAVLSACESGVGEINTGEGTFSIARGFALVGVPSVVMSLWKVNDQVASELMAQMYTEFDSGLSISEALSSSKRKYIRISDEYTSHPYYWSAFVSLGQEVYLNDKNNNNRIIWVLLLVFGMLLSLISGYFLLRKKDKEP